MNLWYRHINHIIVIIYITVSSILRSTPFLHNLQQSSSQVHFLHICDSSPILIYIFPPPKLKHTSRNLLTLFWISFSIPTTLHLFQFRMASLSDPNSLILAMLYSGTYALVLINKAELGCPLAIRM